jgi:hypothetical protein
MIRKPFIPMMIVIAQTIASSPAVASDDQIVLMCNASVRAMWYAPRPQCGVFNDSSQTRQFQLFINTYTDQLTTSGLLDGTWNVEITDKAFGIHGETQIYNGISEGLLLDIDRITGTITGIARMGILIAGKCAADSNTPGSLQGMTLVESISGQCEKEPEKKF